MKNLYNALVVAALLCAAPRASAQVDHWEQLVDAHDIWKYRLGNSEPSSAWKTLGFNDASWLSGPGSIGYGDNDDSTIINPVSSIYMRREFQVNQLSEIEALVFHADFDDAFVAYLNGVEIARGNIDVLVPAFNTPPKTSRNATTYAGAATWQGGVPGAWVIQDTLWQGVLQSGNNVLAVHTLDSAQTWDMTTKYWLHVGVSTPNVVHAPAANWFDFQTFSSPVGIMRINTYGRDIDPDERILGTMAIVWDSTGAPNPSYASANNVLTNISIKKRGSGSLYIYPKHGYSIESRDKNWEDVDISPMGLPEEEDWVLHGPYSDRSFMRNVLAMHLARETGQYASRTRYLELFVNGEYEGIYVLMEQIKRDKNRVDIAKLNPDEISGDDLTGGYIWRTDWGDPDWRSSFPMRWDPDSLPYQYRVPDADDIAPEQEAYIQEAVDNFEHALDNTAATYNGKYWDEYIDVDSFIDYFLVQELTKNIDAFRASTYYHKDKDSKDGRIKMGPIWDFNLSLGLAISCDGWQHQDWLYNGQCSGSTPFWLEKLVQTPDFADAVRCRWEELTSGPWHRDTLVQFINDTEALLAPIADRNHTRWPIGNGQTSQVHYIDSTYAGDVDIVRQFVLNRMNWMDANMIGAPCSVGLDEETLAEVRFYPNPTTGKVLLRTQGTFNEVIVRTATGREALRQPLPSRDLFAEPFELHLDALTEGMYTCELIGPEGRTVAKIVVAR